MRKQTCFYRGVKSKEGKRRADLPFVATGRAELKFPDEEEECPTNGRNDESAGVDATLAGKIETGERNSLAFQFFKIYSDWPLIQGFVRNRPRNLSPPSTQTLKLRRRQRRLNYCLLSEIWKLIIVPARRRTVAADDRGAVDRPPDSGRVVIVVTDRSVPK